MIKLARMPEPKRREIIEKAKQRAGEEYRPEVVVKRLEKIYGELVEAAS
jgi:glycosyltransferase involved in cell wall biosynthesis